MLVVYLVTINPWVSVLNLGAVTSASGWLWVPDLGSPVYQLVTLPLRVLPATAIPAALNLFSLVCAVPVLIMLARSVALLPRDRTEAQLARERNDFALLTIRSAWLPPVLAVLICGLQLSFWERATNGGSEMFDLLLFAFVVWSLVEYRLDGKETRLFWSAIVVGAGMAEGAAMVAFFPLFVLAIIWVRGLRIFNVRFLSRMALCGLIGFSLLLLFPLVDSLSGKSPWTFWQGMRIALRPQIEVLRLAYICGTDPGQYAGDLLMPLFISLMPLFVLSVRWKTRDNSKMGSLLANVVFHTIHAIFLGVCLWLVFDPPFSPREKGLGLPLYYLIALSAGYYAGYFLLVFGKKHPRIPVSPSGSVKLFNSAVVGGVWVLAVLAVAGLFYKNTPLVWALNGKLLRKYTTMLVEKVPPAGAMLLSDDPQRLYLAEAALVREGRVKDYLLIDTPSLVYPQYHRYLHKKYPDKWPLLVAPSQRGALNPLGLRAMFSMLSQSNAIYYLHPSFGYYFEEFYQEPHGLIYQLKRLPNDTLVPPPADRSLIAENESFWAQAQSNGLKTVEKSLDTSALDFGQQFLEQLDVPRGENYTAQFVGAQCSRSLDFWGVELQRGNDLARAARCFQSALKLNPDNFVAQINLDFNQKIRAGQKPPLDFTQTTSDHFGKFSSLVQAITECGPFDEPAFCFVYGQALAQDNHFFRQAVEPLERVRYYHPEFLPADIWLARIYALNHLPDLALEAMRAPMARPDFMASDTGVTELDLLTAAAYFQKNEVPQGVRLLQTVISNNPTNNTLLTTVERVYLSRGLLTDALALADQKLKTSPRDLNWLLTKGYIYNQQKNYHGAIAMLEPVLAAQTNNVDALYQLANAYYGNGNFDVARQDYLRLQQTYTNSVQLAHNLGDIAWQQRDTNEAIRNYRIYLFHAPTNAPDYKVVSGRLSQLEQPVAGK